MFGNIVDIIILGYNYHLFSSADFFFLISRDTKILTLLFPILLFILYILDIKQDLSVVGRDHGGGGGGYHTHLRIALKRSLAIVIRNMGVDSSG